MSNFEKNHSNNFARASFMRRAARFVPVFLLSSTAIYGCDTRAEFIPGLAPTLGEDSGYNFIDDSAVVIPAGVVNLYQYDDMNNQLIKKEYNLELKTIEYGSGDLSKEFQVNVLGEDVTIEANYNSSDINNYILNSEDNASVDYTGVFLELSNSGNGGAINNTGNLGNFTESAFIGNYITGSRVNGGAIYNTGKIESINGYFIDNKITTTTVGIEGAAIYSSNGEIGAINADFISNGIIGNNGYYNSYGQVISLRNGSKVGEINGNFIGNYSKRVSQDVNGGGYVYGLIMNSGSEIGSIRGDFIGNYFDCTSRSVYGTGIYNQDGKIGSITGDFVGNTLKGANYVWGGGISNRSKNSEIGTINSNFIGNSVYGAKYVYAGALHVDGGAKIGNVYGNFISNSATADTVVKGGAVYVSGSSIGAVDDENNLVGGFINSSFIGNSAVSIEGEALAGAIYTDSDLKIVADDGYSIIADNYTASAGVIDDNAIYVDSADATLTFESNNDGIIQIEDNISGVDNYSVEFLGDGSGVANLNNKILGNANVKLSNSNLNLSSENNLDTTSLLLDGGSLDMVNNQIGVSALNSLDITADTNMVVDVDLANKTMDRFTVSEYDSHSGNLNVTGMNLLSDAVDDKTRILFAENGLKDNVTTSLSEVAYSPIYKYSVSYDKSGEEGYFVFDRFAVGSGNSSGGVETFNPAVLSGSTSATVGAIGTVNQSLNHAFNNVDTFMNTPFAERVSMKNRNKYALSITGDATDMGRFSPLYQPSQEEASVWVKPYATFETVGLKNGPKVHNNTYGTLVGFDSEIQSLKRGWDRVITGYIGYNGASQRYSGVDSTQNGGLIGGTVTMYKGNFFNATTVSVGANVAQNQTMYGKDDFAMLLSGVGNKTGYNFEFKEGKLILQPSMLMSYTFVNTFDYTNAAGVRIDNKPLHALQLAPGVKVIGNLKNGWQPYASVSMVWNLMGESDATANGVKLPEMSIKPYVQYGVGVQKRIKDHFTAYGQAMIQNGGRNGISLTGGFRWALGHDKCKDEEQKVERVNDKSKTLSPTLSLGEGANSSKKIIKQMTPEQRMALVGGKYMNTSRTAKAGSLRQY